MGPAGSFSRYEISQGYLPIHPFPFEMIEKTRLIMALRTRYVPMAGCPPGFHIHVHLMAETAEGGTFCEFEESS
jgi:hypothetical protein